MSTIQERGKPQEIETGTVVFEDVGKWNAEDAVLAVQWLNINVGSFSSIHRH